MRVDPIKICDMFHNAFPDKKVSFYNMNDENDSFDLGTVKYFIYFTQYQIRIDHSDIHDDSISVYVEIEKGENPIW